MTCLKSHPWSGSVRVQTPFTYPPWATRPIASLRRHHGLSACSGTSVTMHSSVWDHRDHSVHFTAALSSKLKTAQRNNIAATTNNNKINGGKTSGFQNFLKPITKGRKGRVSSWKREVPASRNLKLIIILYFLSGWLKSPIHPLPIPIKRILPKTMTNF